jgi:hypothetical protein
MKIILSRFINNYKDNDIIQNNKKGYGVRRFSICCHNKITEIWSRCGLDIE